MKNSLLIILFFVVQWSFAQPGNTDNTFAQNGILSVDWFNTSDYATALTIDKTGNILIAGTTEQGYDTGKQVFVAQFNSKGVIQKNFGQHGKVFISVAHEIAVTKIMVQYDGKILIGGHAHDKEKNAEFFIIRTHADGSLDNSFGVNGIAVSRFFAQYPNLNNKYLMADFDLDFYNNIIAVGTNNSMVLDNMALVKFTPKGTIDEQFLQNGMYVGRFPIATDNSPATGTNTCTAAKVIALSNGMYLIGGTHYISGGSKNYHNFIVQRILNDGKTDSTFNYGQPFQNGFDEASDELSDIMVNANGNYILTGTTNAGDDDFGCMALNKMGFLDYSAFGDVSKKYGITGKTQTGFNKKMNQEAVCSVMLPDGKFVIIGKGNKGVESIVVARYMPNGQLDETFGESGKLQYNPEAITSNDFFDIHDALLDFEGNLLICGWLSQKNSTTKADIFVVAIKL